MSRNSLTLSVAALGLLALSPASQAAISYTGSTITQNFDAFAGAAASLPFSNDGGPGSGSITGLNLYLSGNLYSTTTAATDAVAGVPDYISRNSSTTASSVNSVTYRGSGTVLTSAHYYYRASAAATDAALGLFNNDSNTRGITAPNIGYLTAGFSLTNDTGAPIASLPFTYLAEASTATLTNADPVDVSYAFNATGVADTDGTYTSVPGMGYSTSATAVVTQQTVTSIDFATLSPATPEWLPGQTIFIRFRDANVGGIDRLSWVDDIAIGVPEPTSLAVLGLAGTLLGRRRRSA